MTPGPMYYQQLIETSPSEDADDDSGGESGASNVGSMGSTDHLDEASFATETHTDNGRIDAFLGQTATDNWVDRLDKNLKISDTDGDTGLDYLSANHNLRPPRYSGNPASTVCGGLDDPEAGAKFFAENIDPYGMPPKASADSFVSVYFTTVHPSFPILSRAHFLRTYEQYYSFGDLNRSSTPSLVLIHLVLAIGAMHTYATQASVIGEDKYRLLRFAKSKTTILDASVFQASNYEQVQLCGLGGLYLFVLYEINQAWKLCGFAIRCSQGLGMHLKNTTPDMAESQKSIRLAIWFSVLSLERTLAVITGRPSIVRDLDCTATLPSTGVVDPDVHLLTRNSRDQAESTWQGTQGPAVIMDPNFFLRYVELTSLADSVLSSLYSASIRHVKWQQLQSTIQELDLKLSTWNTTLPEPFYTEPTRQTPEQNTARIAVGMLFHSTRIIINRPCLCRLDYRIDHQSNNSDSINVASANRCIASARATLALIPDEPDMALIYQGPLWWMGFHHLKRTAAVLILGVMFLCGHPSAAAADVLLDSKKAINWLYAMGRFSSPAHSAWVTLSRLFLRTAQSTGGDVSGAVIAEEGKDPGAGFGGSVPPAGQQQASYYAPVPTIAAGQANNVPVSTFEKLFPGPHDASGGGGGNMFSDLGMNELYHFGLEQGEFFPSMVNDQDYMN
ncbi:MAG: hypothetical protein Q9224_002336 [Gallowayella concinna]